MRERKWSLPLEERLSELKRAVSSFEAFKMEYRADERKHGAASQIQESHSPFRNKNPRVVARFEGLFRTSI